MRHSRSALCMLMLIFWAGALQHSSFACEFEAYPLGPALTMTPQPNEGKYPIYMAVRIGDQQVEGVGHVELTVENYRPSMGGLFSSVYFLVDKNGDRP